MFVPAQADFDTSVFRGQTLILPAVTAGAVPQMALEVLALTLSASPLPAAPVGCLHDPFNLTPYAAADARALAPAHLRGALSTGLELHAAPALGAFVLLQRAPALPRRAHALTANIVRWAQAAGFARVLLATADAAHARGDHALLEGRRLEFFTVEPETAALPSAAAAQQQDSFFFAQLNNASFNASAGAGGAGAVGAAMTDDAAAPPADGEASAAALAAPLARACAAAGLPPTVARADPYAGLRGRKSSRLAAAANPGAMGDATAAAAPAAAAAKGADSADSAESAGKDAEAAVPEDICASPASENANDDNDVNDSADDKGDDKPAAAAAADGGCTQRACGGERLNFPIAVAGRGATAALARACRRVALPLAAVVVYTHPGDNAALVDAAAAALAAVAAAAAGRALPQEVADAVAHAAALEAGAADALETSAAAAAAAGGEGAKKKRSVGWRRPVSWAWRDDAAPALSY